MYLQLCTYFRIKTKTCKNQHVAQHEREQHLEVVMATSIAPFSKL